MHDSPGPRHARMPADARAYWRANLLLMSVLLAVWLVVSCGCGIVFTDWLDQFTVPGSGMKLGFWMAQQGSIIVFVLLILVYAVVMNRLDRRFGVDE
jgi:putative solute:sodium symporter small subunit